MVVECGCVILVVVDSSGVIRAFVMTCWSLPPQRPFLGGVWCVVELMLRCRLLLVKHMPGASSFSKCIGTWCSKALSLFQRPEHYTQGPEETCKLHQLKSAAQTLGLQDPVKDPRLKMSGSQVIFLASRPQAASNRKNKTTLLY